jgi:pimeloyl-ACP methyl ester carboxylesterase
VDRPPIRYTKTVDGLHIAYQVVGDGPFDLLWTPGWFSSLECAWEVPELGVFLGELASFSRLVLFDRRGFGISDSPSTSGSWSLEAGMDDIGAVLDALGLDVRAGVHTGEVQTIDGKAGGLAVNIGARVAASAAPREVLVSST